MEKEKQLSIPASAGADSTTISHRTALELDLASVPYDSAYNVGRGFLHPDKLAIAEAYRGKPVSVIEIRLCLYMYDCYVNSNFGYWYLKDSERPLRKEWETTAGILEPDRSVPTFTEYGKKFAEFVLKWAYPVDYIKLVGVSKSNQ